jgi:hypothetical protein
MPLSVAKIASVFAAGPHPVRELLDGSFNITLALPGFCEILR